MNIIRPWAFDGNGVHVWSARFADTNTASSTLSAEERERLSKMPLEKRRVEFAQGRFGLRRLASIYLDQPESEIRVKIDTNGKPRLDHGPSAPAISLSHSEGRIAYALSTQSTVGVDIERRRPLDIKPLADRILSRRERALFGALTDDRGRLDFFFDLWTRKEAVSKFLGLGLRAPFQEIEVSGETVTYGKEALCTRSFDWDDFRMAVAYRNEPGTGPTWKGSLLP